MYTIKEVARRVNESEHTIRYYAKLGLFPFLKRDKNNTRLCCEENLEGVKIVLCLRDTNMPLHEIKQYMDLCIEGDSTIELRLQMIQEQRIKALKQLQEFQAKIEHLEWKEAFYKNTLKEGIKDLCNPLNPKGEQL